MVHFARHLLSAAINVSNAMNQLASGSGAPDLTSLPNCNIARLCPNDSNERDRITCISAAVFSTVPVGQVDQGIVVYQNGQGKRQVTFC